MSGINVLTCVLLMVWSVHHSACLLMDDPDAASTAARLDAMERALAEEKLLRMNMSAELSSEKQQRIELSLQVEAQGTHTGSGYPAFMATLSSSIDHCPKDQHVIFTDVKLNTADAYSSHHGVFTAPIAGTYIFTTTLTPIPNNTYHVRLVKNDEQNWIGYLFANRIEMYIQNSITVVTHMDVDDEVWMLCNGRDSRIAGGWNSHMSGFLISPDP